MWFMVDAALKGTAVLGVAWLVAFCMRGRSAAARHVVWTAAFAALLRLPFLSLSLPALRVPVKSGLAPDILIRTSARPPVAESVAGRSAGVVPKSGPGRRQPDWGGILLLLWAAGAAAGSAQ